MLNVLLLESIAEEALDLLRGSVNVLRAKSPHSGAEVAAEVAIHAIVTRGKGDVSQALIEQCPNLQVIARCGVGLDNVDVAFATTNGVRVLNAPGSNADTVAEHTLSLMLSLQRQTWAAIAAVKAGNWSFRNTFGGDEIRGKTLGILGYGNIGKRVGRLAEAFGMEVLYAARPQVQGEQVEQRCLPLDTLLAQSDILTLHLPLTASTKGLLSAEKLALLQPGALIINTARGEIIDEVALLAGLTSGHIGGYAADVLTVEPPAPDAELLSLPNVLVTPHAASLTASTYAAMCLLTVSNTLKILAGEPIDQKYLFNREDL